MSTRTCSLSDPRFALAQARANAAASADPKPRGAFVPARAAHRITARIALAATLPALPCQSQQPSPPRPAGGKVEQPAAPTPPTATAKPAATPRPRVLSNGAGAGDTDAEVGKLPGSARGLVKLHASCTPSAVAPGARGTMVVVLSLAGDAVMLDPPPAEFLFDAVQGALLVTQPTFRPPLKPGTAPALKGVANYDDLVIADVPFTVGADARPGTQRLEVGIRYQLFHGQKGGELGTFTDRVGVDVVVADEAESRPGARTADRSGATAASDGTGDTTGSAAGRPPVTAGTETHAAAPTETPSPALPGGPPPADAWPILPLVGGGALLLLVIALAGSRLRRAARAPTADQRGG